jgi:hypothetical protein
MKIWKINCMEDSYPGMWQRWFRHQCVAVGWRTSWGYCLSGPTKDDGGKRTRATLQRMGTGDYVAVSLKGNRVGRLGQITGKAVDDADWDPLVRR